MSSPIKNVCYRSYKIRGIVVNNYDIINLCHQSLPDCRSVALPSNFFNNSINIFIEVNQWTNIYHNEINKYLIKNKID